MRILVVGGNGAIGKAVVAELSQRHEVVIAGRSAGDFRVNIADPQSVSALYASTGPLDAVACAAGNVKFGPLESMTAEDYDVGLRDKLMGQVNLVLAGRSALNRGGSFTLITGILTSEPIRFGSSASLVNGALESFVRAAAIELPDHRINAVSPTVLEEALPAYGPYFRGFEAVPAKRVALAYSKSIEGANTGQIYRVL
ncbi:MAG TPA: short chain dehydrogenase [Candidatus Cybelea sp.]|jgi:NAD(P)-dependent dehydrogenase (short-subunit alcohol dehydrogenase family)